MSIGYLKRRLNYPELLIPGHKPTHQVKANLQHPHLRDCVAWWPFFEPAGETLQDIVGGHHATIIQGIERTTADRSIALDCTNAKADCSSAVGSGSQLTIVIWLSRFSTSQGWFHHGSGANEGVLVESFSGKYYVSPGSTIWTIATPAAAANEMRMFSWTMDDVSNASKIYENAVILTDTTNAAAIDRASILRLLYRNLSNWGCDTIVKDIRYYDRALTQDELLALYQDYYAPLLPASDLYVLGAGGAGGVNLVIAGSAHGHIADNLVLTQAHQLAVAESSHGHAADNIALTQAHALSVVDSTHGHAADNIDLSVSQELAVAEATHGHASDNIDLTQAHQLAISESTHGHTVENIVLQAAGTLAVQDSLHGHVADDIALTQAHVLAIAESVHSHAADNLNLDSSAILTILDGAHGHAADNIALTQSYILSVQDALHDHAAENVGLEVDHATLIISDALHAHLADQCNVSEQITVIETPGERIFMIQAEGRVIAVSAGPRAFPIQ